MDGSIGSADVWTDERWELAGYWRKFDACLVRFELKRVDAQLARLERTRAAAFKLCEPAYALHYIDLALARDRANAGVLRARLTELEAA